MFVNMFEENNEFARHAYFETSVHLTPTWAHSRSEHTKIRRMCISRKVTHPDTVDTTYDSAIHC